MLNLKSFVFRLLPLLITVILFSNCDDSKNPTKSADTDLT